MNDEKRMPDRFSGDFGQQTWDLNKDADMVAFVKTIDPSRRSDYLQQPALLPYTKMHLDAIRPLVPWNDCYGEWLGPIHFCMDPDPPESIPESENRGEGRDATGQEGTTEPAPRVERD